MAACSGYGLLAVVAAVSLLARSGADAQLWPEFYATSCPELQGFVRSVMAQAVGRDPRMGASILRLFFHDCFVSVRPNFESLLQPILLKTIQIVSYLFLFHFNLIWVKILYSIFLLNNF